MRIYIVKQSCRSNLVSIAWRIRVHGSIAPKEIQITRRHRNLYESSWIGLCHPSQNPLGERIIEQYRAEDHALARPWTVKKTMRRGKDPIWVESICSEGNVHVEIGQEHYMLNPDRLLMPMYKDQPAPDLRLFERK